MIKFIKSLDQFGVSFQPNIYYSTSEYKTVQGGVMSVLLYGLSFSYLIYMMVQWQQGQILPKVTTLSNYVPDYKLELNERFMQIEMRKYSYTSIDPFNPESVILQPVIYYFINGQSPDKGYPQSYEKKINMFNFHIIELQNLTIQTSSELTTENPQIEMMVVFGQCLDVYLQEGQKCADNKTIQNFFDQQTNTLIVKQSKKEFNTNSETLDNIDKELVIPLTKEGTFYAQVNTKISYTQVDQGFLFESFDDYEYITDYQVTGNSMNKDYFGKKLGYETYAVFYYKVDQIQTLSQITYPKISEILADAGSIASTLLLLSYIVILMNQSYMQFEAVNHIISMYYPEFKNVKIIKNIFGKIIRVESHGKLLNLNLFFPYYEKLKRIGEMKLTISNQIYEISRIQFLLQSQYSNKFISKFHQVGIPFPNLTMESIVIKEDNQSKLENSIILQDQNYKSNQILPNVESQDYQLKKEVVSRKASTIVLNAAKQDDNQNEQSRQVKDDGQKTQELNLKDEDFELLTMQEEYVLLEDKEINSKDVEQIQPLQHDPTNADLFKQHQPE
ncbi:unnamed protein product [Paramecium pentaurelia]|uniref:Transmembrane protein n=1 Tax=Paramecium pentaurelia TaxID=43138 RepID=A0A8S1W2K7_9CILI|nr:unnamed protein product [Paramecium pentaurelia]